MNTTHRSTAGRAPAIITPWPWICDLTPGSLHYGEIRGAVNASGCRPLVGRGPAFAEECPEWPANAPVLAAAPELLEACEQAEYWLSEELANPGAAAPEEILRVLRAAIAKARDHASPGPDGKAPGEPVKIGVLKFGPCCIYFTIEGQDFRSEYLMLPGETKEDALRRYLRECEEEEAGVRKRAARLRLALAALEAS